MRRRIPFLLAVLLLAGCNVVGPDYSGGSWNDSYENTCLGCRQSSCICRSERKRSGPDRSVDNYRKK